MPKYRYSSLLDLCAVPYRSCRALSIMPLKYKTKLQESWLHGPNYKYTYHGFAVLGKVQIVHEKLLYFWSREECLEAISLKKSPRFL